MPRTTLSARLSTLEDAIARLIELEAARTPAVSAPAQAKAESPFVKSLRERAQSRTRCAVHAGCTRSFTPASSGATSHVACKGCDERKHHHAR